jgi:phosphoglycerate dehydrogenase-like enzyme
MTQTFRIALSGDFYHEGQPKYPAFDLGVLEGVRGVEYFAFERHLPEIDPRQFAGAQAAIVLAPRVSRGSLSMSDDLLAIARFGVGYDTVDVAACTEADVVLLIARGAVDRPVAEATLGWMIALSHHFRVKDALVREDRWNERVHFMGTELRGRTLGVIGFGGIARELVRLLSVFGMNRTSSMTRSLPAM